MFDLERWEEIFNTIRKNKLRTFLTGLSVASGIFILVILLGFGQGMQNGIAQEFEADASNRIWVWTQVTTKEYKGLNPGRSIRLINENFDNVLASHLDQLEHRSAVFRVRTDLISYKKESGNYAVQGVHPDYQFIENQRMLQGRYLNFKDLQSTEKVIVISNKIKNDLFGDEEIAIDKLIQISGINFRVIGVYSDHGGEREENRVFVPITTAQKVFGGGNRIANLSFTLKPEENFEQAVRSSDQFVQQLTKYLKQSHVVAPDDPSAINVFNTLTESKRYYDLMRNIKLFFWFVGVCTIIAGVVGVSNIMLIIVKERTREIGVRKALGAQPWSIVAMVLHESVFVTAISGFGGLIFSMGLLEILGPNIEVDYIVNPSVNFNVAVTTVIVLILAGAFAGFFPAWRAARIQPIVALRDE